MPKIRYVAQRFSPKTRRTIGQAIEIIERYVAQGYDLTLRQLYYQFVSRDLIKNNLKEYKRLGSIINDARLAGYIDWNHITDRTRNLHSLGHWSNPGDILDACVSSYRVDKWETQPRRIEVWIEKEALAGVFQRVCDEFDVPFFSCRGYTSQSEMWVASQRLRRYMEAGQQPYILHFGDHDPSGMDMTRDIRNRLAIFMADVDLNRLALNMDQIEAYEPPPNPAKTTDSRYEAYIKEYGSESWELDALEPSVLADLVRKFVQSHIDKTAWNKQLKREETDKKKLVKAAKEMKPKLKKRRKPR